MHDERIRFAFLGCRRFKDRKKRSEREDKEQRVLKRIRRAGLSEVFVSSINIDRMGRALVNPRPLVCHLFNSHGLEPSASQPIIPV